MQIHEEALEGADRPCAPSECERCLGCQRLHYLGSYERNADCTGDQKEVTRRYRCPRCGKTFGIIPRGMLPYRSLRVDRLEQYLDGACGLAAPWAGGEPRPAPASEIEAGCIRRARERLSERIPFLCGLLGQQLPALARNDIGGFWRALRPLGRLVDMLVHLAAKFKVSLLANYRSLFPNWPRAAAPG